MSVCYVFCTQFAYEQINFQEIANKVDVIKRLSGINEITSHEHYEHYRPAHSFTHSHSHSHSYTLTHRSRFSSMRAPANRRNAERNNATTITKQQHVDHCCFITMSNESRLGYFCHFQCIPFFFFLIFFLSMVHI